MILAQPCLRAFCGTLELKRPFPVGLIIPVFLPSAISTANVTIDAADKFSTVSDVAYGIHTSVYDKLIDREFFMNPFKLSTRKSEPGCYSTFPPLYYECE